MHQMHTTTVDVPVVRACLSPGFAVHTQLNELRSCKDGDSWGPKQYKMGFMTSPMDLVQLTPNHFHQLKFLLLLQTFSKSLFMQPLTVNSRCVCSSG